MIARGVIPIALIAIAFGASGCGEDEPAYCSDLGELEQSVNQLGDVDVVGGGTDAVREALREVEADARSVIDSAQSEFSDETDAIAESLSTLEASVRQLSGSPSTDQTATVLADASELVTSVDELIEATASRCE
jgi:hypothetical protein